jgi:hypothetical protein|tara:strand:+ start:390 stop:1136 length:747 start_codon:yes stop_codon:yes gene_type:complete
MSKTNNKKAVSILEEMSKDSGGGFEEVTSSDVQIPFVRVIQAMSPQIKKSDSAFIKGAGQGDIFNTVTKQFWSAEDGILVIPTYFQQKLLEFVPREQGGGFVGELKASSEEVKKAQRNDMGAELLENGNELVRTAQHYVKIVHEDGSLENAIVDMKKTQLKKSRGWMSIMMMQKHNGKTLPSFSQIYRLKTVEEGNDKGSWYSWSIQHEKMVEEIESYNDAKSFHTSIKSGELTALPPTDANKDEVPF